MTVGEIAALTGAESLAAAPLDRAIYEHRAARSRRARRSRVHGQPKYVDQLPRTRAGACLVSPRFEKFAPPHVALLRARAALSGLCRCRPEDVRRHAAAVLDVRRSRILRRAPSCIRRRARGRRDRRSGRGHRSAMPRSAAGTVIGASAVIGPAVRIGRDCAIGAGAIDRRTPLIGDRVIVHPGCRIGQDGFGFVMGAGGHQKVPQIGRVIIQDDVEIGAGTTIDRGAIRDTVIGEGTKIDNLVQIGHNVAIGRHCVIVAQCGICRQRAHSGITSCSVPGSGSTITSRSAKAPSLRRRRACTATFPPARAGVGSPPSR